MKQDGSYATSNSDIMREAHRHFSDFYKADSRIDANCQRWMMQHIQRFFEDNDISQLNEPITVNEVLLVLKSFSPDKCRGPDGWPSEFFLFFFKIMGAEVAEVVELFRVQGMMLANLNSTFIALIPKSEEPIFFLDYKTIDLCNLI